MHWRRWTESADGARTLRQWSQHRELEGWTTNELCEPRQRNIRSVNDMQVQLVRLSQNGCSRALATLVVQLRPGLVRLARSAALWPWTMLNSHSEACSEVQAAFIESVFSVNVQRRQNRMAANLVNDTRQHLWRSSPIGWRSGNQDRPTWHHGLADHNECPESTDAMSRVEIMVDLGSRLRQPPRDGSAPSAATVEMAYLAWVEGYRLAEVADRVGHSPGAVANRLHRLRTQLRSEAEASPVTAYA